jgi:hypothetical protein
MIELEKQIADCQTMIDKLPSLAEHNALRKELADMTADRDLWMNLFCDCATESECHAKVWALKTELDKLRAAHSQPTPLPGEPVATDTQKEPA